MLHQTGHQAPRQENYHQGKYNHSNSMKRTIESTQSTDIEKKYELMCSQYYFHPAATTCNFFYFKSKIAPNKIKQKKDVKKSFEHNGKLIWYSIIFSSFRL